MLQVEDSFLGAGGRFALAIRDGRAECTPTQAHPDVVLDLDVLGSLYLGAHRARTFAAARRLRTDGPETLESLDRAFGAERSAQMGWAF